MTILFYAIWGAGIGTFGGCIIGAINHLKSDNPPTTIPPTSPSPSAPQKDLQVSNDSVIHTHTEPPHSLSSQKPNVTAKIVYSDEIALVLLNNSSVVAKDPRIFMELFDLDAATGSTLPSPLQIPFPNGDGSFIKAGSYMIPLSLVGHPNVKSQIKKGDRIVGWFSVTCQDCSDSNVYWVYAVHGSRGWYAPCEKGKYPQLNAITKNWNDFVEHGESLLSEVVPMERRIPITDDVP